jgi:hypothetical protein
VWYSKIVLRFVAAIFFLLFALQGYAQESNKADSIVIQGAVIDEKMLPVFAATVIMRQQGKIIGGQVTDETGKFSITIPASTTDTSSLTVHYPGYYATHIRIKDLTRVGTIQLKLNPNDIGCSIPNYKIPLIDGYEPTKRSFTSDDIEKMPR